MTDLNILGQILKAINLKGKQISLTEVNYSDLSIGKNTYVTKGSKVIGLNLRQNKLTALPKEVMQLSNLIRLVLNENQLMSLPKEISLLTNLTELYLNDNELKTLPKEIIQLSNLSHLVLSNNQLTVLPREITQLPNLNWLNLSKNKLTTLPKELAQLSNLNTLELDENKLTIFPREITQLPNLNVLDLSKNKLTILSKEIPQLSNLNRLYLSKNKLITLPKAIVKLSKLTELYLNENQLINLPKEIAQLSNLKQLILSKNQLTTLPKEIAQLSDLKLLDLTENKFNIPNHIYNKSPKEQISYILNLQEQGAIPLNEGKMILLGNGEVGKTALIEQLVKGTFSGTTKMTEGISITPWQIEEVTLNIWDFGGQEIMRAMHQFFMTERTLYVLVDKHRTGDSGTPLEDWLQLIATFGGDSPVLIVVSHSDVHDLNIDENRLKDDYPNIVGFYRASAKTTDGIEILRTAIQKQLNCEALKHIKNDVPSKWINVKEALIQEQRTKNYINLQEYYRLCDSKEIKDNEQAKNLLKLLHDLGISFNYGSKNDPNDTNILKPEWVTKGIYSIINNNDFFQQDGKIELPQVEKLLAKLGDYKDKERVIIGLMEQFELCFEIGNDRYLVPDLLPKRQPFIGNQFDDGLKLIYGYEFLPLSVIPQFITKIHELAINYWLHGVIVKNDENTALIRVNYTKNQISISVIGELGGRRSLLGIIRKHFTVLNARFTGFEPNMFVPYPPKPDILIDYQLLTEAEREGDKTIRVKGIKDQVNVKDLLNSVDNREEKVANLVVTKIREANKEDKNEAFLQQGQEKWALQQKINQLETPHLENLEKMKHIEISIKNWAGIIKFLYWLFFGLGALFLTIYYISPNWNNIAPFTLLFGVIITSILLYIPAKVVNFITEIISNNAYQTAGISKETIEKDSLKLHHLKEEFTRLSIQ